MKAPTSTVIAEQTQGRVVGALAELKAPVEPWKLVALADLVQSVVRHATPKEIDPGVGAQVIALVAELVAGAYADHTKWRDPPEDGWPRGEGRRKRLGAIAEAVTTTAALATPDLESLPPALRHRAMNLARAAVVMLARSDPETGSRLLAPQLAAEVLQRATQAARSAHEMGAKP
jgi:hypothetical protein